MNARELLTRYLMDNLDAEVVWEHTPGELTPVLAIEVYREHGEDPLVILSASHSHSWAIMVSTGEPVDLNDLARCPTCGEHKPVGDIPALVAMAKAREAGTVGERPLVAEVPDEAEYAETPPAEALEMVQPGMGRQSIDVMPQDPVEPEDEGSTA